MNADNAIIMAAGTASRFAPLSYEKPKALISVRGEVLIERQIRQIREAGINDIAIVTGYKADSFEYLKEKFGVTLIHNPDYDIRNNNSSIFAARNFLKNTYVCSSDNYFIQNPFTKEVEDSYYAACFSKEETSEWCIQADKDDYISSVKIGGENSWYMLGQTFWSQDFSKRFLEILEKIYNEPETNDKLWESIFIEHLDSLKMKIKRYPENYIFEFDSLDELRLFDPDYIENPRSKILESLSKELNIPIGKMKDFKAVKNTTNEAVGFSFCADGKKYTYDYKSGGLL